MKGREHGRIMSVETKVRGDALAEDALAGATTLTVGDAADFDEDGGWLVINDQVVEFTEVDDDEGIITLATGLEAAGDEGDAVHVWSTLYDEAVDYQEALVELDGEYDNPEPVVAEVAEGVGDLPEGDRGVDGESCTLIQVSDDEWEVVGVGGRPRRAQAIKFYQDSFTVPAAGAQSFQLTHTPIEHSEHLYWNGLYQPGSQFSRTGREVSISADAGYALVAGDIIDVEYAYRTGFGRRILVPFQATGWKHLQIAIGDSTNRSGTGFDDSSWSTSPAPFGDAPDGTPSDPSWPNIATAWSDGTAIWLRRTVAATAGSRIILSVRYDDQADVYWNGTLVGSVGSVGTVDDPDGGGVGQEAINVPSELVTASNTLAVRASDKLNTTNPLPHTYIDVEVSQ